MSTPSGFDLDQFKADYKKFGKYNLEVQIPHLAALAEDYFDRYQKDGRWTDGLRAHSLFNSVGVRDPKAQNWYDKVYRVQQAYCGEAVKVTQSDERQLVETLSHKLQTVRNETRGQLEKATGYGERFTASDQTPQHRDLVNDFSRCMMKCSVDCTNGMINVVEQVMKHCVLIMQEKPPCSFAAVAIGSLARGEATPYSDLEYMFLLASGSKTPHTVRYFEKLAIISYFIIGNLRETKLSYMAIEELQCEKWFDDKAMNGLKIDGLAPQAGNIPTGNGIPKTRVDGNPSGNIPTGNGDPLKENQFITTPEVLAERYKATLLEPVEKEALFGDLTAMLAYMKSFYTYKHPQDQKGPDILAHLKNLIAAIKPNEKRKAVNMKMLENDMGKFNFKPDYKLYGKGFTVDVKKDLYRFPSLLVYDLSIVYDCVGDSVWETIDLLYKNKHLSEHVRESIRFQLACACYVRLSAYLFHDSHDDRVSLLETSSAVGQLSVEKGEMSRWPMPGGLLFAMCGFMIPLKGAIENNPADIDSTLMMEMTESDWWSSLQAIYYCGWYRKASEFLISKFENDIFCGPESLSIELTSDMCAIIGDIMHRLGHREQAQRYFNAYDGKTVEQALKGLNVGGMLGDQQDGVAGSSGIEQSSPDSILAKILTSSDHQFLKLIGIGWQPFQQQLAIHIKANSETTQNIPNLIKVLRLVEKVLNVIFSPSRGLVDELRVCLESCGIKQAQAYESYNEKVEAICICVMWNGDAVDRLIGVSSSRSLHQASAGNPAPTESVASPSPAGGLSGVGKETGGLRLPAAPKLQLLDYMKLEPVKRLDSFESLSVTTWFTMLSVGVWYSSIGKHSVAEAYIEKAASLLCKRFGKDAVLSQAAVIFGVKALNMSLRGEEVVSDGLVTEARDLFMKRYGQQSPVLKPLNDIMNWIGKLKAGDEFGSHLEFINESHIDVIATIIFEWFSPPVRQTAAESDDLD